MDNRQLIRKNRNYINELKEAIEERKHDLEEWIKQLKRELEGYLYDAEAMITEAETYQEAARDIKTKHGDDLEWEEEEELKKQLIDCKDLLEQAEGIKDLANYLMEYL